MPQRWRPRCCAFASSIALLIALAAALGECPVLLYASQDDTQVPRATSILPAEPVWTRATGGPPVAAPAIDEHRIYVPVRPGDLVAVSIETGDEAWTRALAATQSPLPINGSLFVATADGLHELDPASGRSLRQIPLPAPPSGPVTADGGHLIVPLADASVCAVRMTDGSVVWHRPLGAVSATRATIGPDEGVWLSLGDGRVVALSRLDGRVRWERPLSGTLTAPTVARNRVFIGSTDGTFYALDAHTGRLAWHWAIGADVVGVTADFDTVYVVALDNVARALHPRSGNQRWRRVLATRPVGPPLLVEGTLLVAGVSQALVSIDTLTGVITDTFTLEGPLQHAVVHGPPLIVPRTPAGTITAVVITRDGRLTALRRAATR